MVSRRYKSFKFKNKDLLNMQSNTFHHDTFMHEYNVL